MLSYQKKDVFTYEKLFSILKINADWNPETVIMDFEKSAIIAFRNLFPILEWEGVIFITIKAYGEKF